jgi:hypothetical protein
MREPMSFLDGLDWSGLIGNALALFAVLAILVLMLGSGMIPFKKKLQFRRSQEQRAKRRRALLEASVRTQLLPALI